MAALVLASEAASESEDEPELPPKPVAAESDPQPTLSTPSLVQLPTTDAEMQRRLMVGTICRVVSAAAITRDLEVNERSRVVATLQVPTVLSASMCVCDLQSAK